jgi:hypothetical protein
MVLGDPGGVEAFRLGVTDLLGGEAIALAGVALVEQAREETEAPDGDRAHRARPGMRRRLGFRPVVIRLRLRPGHNGP